MDFYSPTTATTYNTVTRIDAAYRAADKTRTEHPTITLRDRIRSAPSVRDVANSLALDSLSLEPGTDVDAWHRDALESIRDAMAADTLRTAFSGAWETMQARVARDLGDQAAADLALAFNATVKALTTAAKSLPAEQPLDPEACLAADAGAALTTAREALARLSHFGSLHQNPIGDDVTPPKLRALLCIVKLPTPTVETAIDGEPTNSDQLKDTYTIRTVADCLKDHGTDETLVRIARGDFPGVSLDLATFDEHQARNASVRDAFIRRRDHAAERAMPWR